MPAGRPGGTLLVDLAGEPASWDPSQVQDLAGWRVLSCLFETLVRPGPRPGQYLEGLARSWRQSRDGREWVFFLRRDVYFHDGRPMNAFSVVFSLRRQFDPQRRPYRTALAQHVVAQSLLGGNPPVLERVEALDEFSVRLVLRQPLQDFLEILCQPAMAVVSPAVVLQTDQPVGTGPFRLAEWRAGQRISLRANLHYYRGRPFLDQLVFRSVADPAARAREIERGNADLAASVDPAEADRLKGLPDLVVERRPGTDGAFLYMNCSQLPWSDQRARVGLSQALHRRALARQFYGERGRPAGGVVPPESWAFDGSVKGYAFDRDRAFRLLRDVGRNYRPQLLVARDSRSLARPAEAAAEVARSLQAVGLAVDPRLVENEELRARLSRGDYDLALVVEELGEVDPDLYLYPRWSRSNLRRGGTNWARWSNDPMQNLLTQGRTTSDRLPVYRDVQRRIQEAAAVVPLAWGPELLAWRRQVRDLGIDRLGLLHFEAAWLER
jgi:peptide/nickel transport system substrate-binding protein